MLENSFRYALEFFKPDGAALGRIPADIDWEPALEWARLEAERASLFPGARGRIPNFRGAAAAADLLAGAAEWKAARVLKCNPDSPQRPVRLRALEEGKVVYMAVPRNDPLTAKRQESVETYVATKGVAELSYPDCVTYINQMRRFNSPLIFTDENWGLADLKLPETKL